MNPATSTTLTLDGDEYVACLTEAGIMELEIKFGHFQPDGRKVMRSIVAIYATLLDSLVIRDDGTINLVGYGDIAIEEINDVLLHGLIGGGRGPDVDGSTMVDPRRAQKLVASYGAPRRPIEVVAGDAFKILHAAIHGAASIRATVAKMAQEAVAA